ncbi:MAG TPA: TetR/AcrR family transcriptional regulator [Thermoplasmata archaeon]|nr:TetR/AcrR family transcriptional regulator [Thermoplasmata archaeon]
MVSTAALLIGTRGVSATSFSEVLEASGAPRGSIYHYFPRGKRQLVEDSLRWTSEQVLDYQRRCRSGSPERILRHFVQFFRRSVVSSDCEAGCPVAAVVIGAYVDRDELSGAVHESFESWRALLAEQLAAAGLTPARARSLAVTALASVEGALLLCRAQRSVDPLDEVEAELERLGRGARRPGA